MKHLIVSVLAFCLAAWALAESYPLSAPGPEALRPGGSLTETLPADPMAGDPRTVERQVRNYPEQPPVIPHVIRGYQVDKRFNRCLDCHSREDAPRAGAPMVSITHFTGRDGQVKAAVTPRRYFCTQCHVPQTDAEPLVESDFMSVDEVIRRSREESQP